MPFTPTTAAQQIAALAGANQADLATPLTSLQDSINGVIDGVPGFPPNLAPAAFIDAIASCFGPQYHGRFGVLGTKSYNGGTMVPVGNGTSDGFAPATFVPRVTRNYSILLTLMAANNAVGGITWWSFEVNGVELALTPPWMCHYAMANQHVSIATQTKADLVAGVSYVFKPRWGTSGTTATVDSNDGWSIIIL